MATRKDTIFEQYLAPIARFFVNENEMRRLHNSIDWKAECDRFTNPDLVYPNYYKTQNFHGIEGGYLTIGAATSYDPITQLALPPNETWVRQQVIDAIQGQPLRILDLGCGTGSTTLLLKQAFPSAEVFGLDLSPFMLAVADHKAKQADLKIHWIHGKAEHTKFSDHSFDVVTASLLFHETPASIAKLILQECYRLLKSSGEVVILDGSQKTLRQTEWLTQIFEEPYIREYAHDSTEAWMGLAGFSAAHTEEFWWLHQITHGIKALASTDFEEFDEFDGEFAVS
ncbi:MAG: methyltransferase type 11 [Leptolyngbya sp. ERB_1_1]|mgnify:FL=1